MMCGVLVVDFVWGEYGVVVCIVVLFVYVLWFVWYGCDFDVMYYGVCLCVMVVQMLLYLVVKLLVSFGFDLMIVFGVFDLCLVFFVVIDVCWCEGGGWVVVLFGNWYCVGLIVLQSNVMFYLSVNCMIYFSLNLVDYVKDGLVDCGVNGWLYYSCWQVNDCLNYGVFVYVCNVMNIVLIGEGLMLVFNGQVMMLFFGSGVNSVCWWIYKGLLGVYGVGVMVLVQNIVNLNNVDLWIVVFVIFDVFYVLFILFVMLWQQDQNYLFVLFEVGVLVEKCIFGFGYYLWLCMVEFIGCINVLMVNYQMQNMLFWQYYLIVSCNVVICGVMINSIGLNNDGFDLDVCIDVLCEDCMFNIGDDCIVIKLGKDCDIEYGFVKWYLICNCMMNSGYGGIMFGSEMGGGVEQIYVFNLLMLNVNWQINLLNIVICVKINMNCGGYVKDFYVKGVMLLNGLMLKGGGYGSVLFVGSLINVSVLFGVVMLLVGNLLVVQGGIVMFDCDYQLVNDVVCM